MSFWPQDWMDVLLPRAPVLESVVRASLIYVVVFLLFRVVLRRESGGLGVSDLLVILLVAAAAHGSLSPSEAGIGDGLVLIGTLVFWDWLLNVLAYHQRWFARLVRPRPVRIVKDGRIVAAAARRELLTRDEILEQLRLHGVGAVSEVREAFMEPDGEFSVIRTKDGEDGRGEARKRPRTPDLHR